MKTLLLSLICCFSTSLFAKTIYPKTLEDLTKVAVKLTNIDGTSGGSGVIYRSYDSHSIILTNAHVCKILVHGGSVTTSDSSYLIYGYKIYSHHDICEVLVLANLKYRTKLAKKLSPNDLSITAGFPYLSPLTIQLGSFTNATFIKMGYYDTECKHEVCIAVVKMKRFKANYFSNKIAPGNSGSAIFNEHGRIVGLVFAGIGRGLSFTYAVPLSALKAIKVLDKKFTIVSEFSVSKRVKTSRHRGLKLHTPAVYDKTLDRIFSK